MQWSLQSPLPHMWTALRRVPTFRVMPKKVPVSRALFSGLLGFVGIFAANMILHADASLGPLSPSFGALATLLYAAPAARFSRPRNVIVGNSIGAAIGMLCSLGLSDDDVWMNMWLPAAAVALTIALTSLVDAVHPPSGAVALFAALPSFNRSRWYIVAPIMLGDAMLLLVAFLFNNVVRDAFFRFPALKQKATK